MFGSRSFCAALLILLLSIGMVGGIYLFITQYLQLVEDLSPLVAGLWLLPPAIALIVASMLTPIIARKVRPGRIVGAAMLVAAVGYLVLALVDNFAGLPVLVAGFILVYIGSGPVMVLAPTWWSRPHRRRRPGRRRPCRRRAWSSASRWGSRSWGSSAPRSTAVRCPAPCPPRCRWRPPTSPATPSQAPRPPPTG